jgi:hypothetical protein
LAIDKVAFDQETPIFHENLVQKERFSSWNIGVSY